MIGRRGRDVAEEDALDDVAGAMAFNDVSARDLQLADSAVDGRQGDRHVRALRPALVTLDELGDLQALASARASTANRPGRHTGK